MREGAHTMCSELTDQIRKVVRTVLIRKQCFKKTKNKYTPPYLQINLEQI